MLDTIKTSKKLMLSFDFVMQEKIERNLSIKAQGLLRDVKWNENAFGWFMEDLVYFMNENKFQQRWDVTTIQVTNCQSLKIKKEEFKQLKDFVKQVIQWTIKLSY